MAGDPLWIDVSGGTPEYSDAELRRAMAVGVMFDGRLVGGREGVRPGGNQLKVTLAGSTITVDLGVGVVDPAWTTPDGPYWVALGGQETHTLTAADATNPRKDIVVARVYHDALDGGSGLRTFRSDYLVGTPAPSPSEPAVPAGAFKLALIDVPASGGGSPAVTDRRPWTVAPGGVLPVNDSTEEAALSPYDGLVICRLDTDLMWARLNGAWHELFAVGKSVMAISPSQVDEGTDIAGFTDTSYVAGSPVCGVAFTAPPSGKVFVTVSGHITSSVNQNQAQLSYEVREGASIGSGTVHTAADPTRALISSRAVNSGAPAEHAASHRRLISTLTAGASYNVRTMHRMQAGGSGTIFFRSLLVEPVH